MASTAPLPIHLLEQEWTDSVPSPAHDSLTPAMRRDILDHNPWSYLAVTRSQDDLPPDVTMTDDQLLRAGRLALASLVDANAFRPPDASRYLVYRLTTETHVQTGIVGGVATDDFESGVVKVHEQIHPARALHLARHFEVVGAQSSPIALSHTPLPAIQRIIDLVTATAIASVTVAGHDGLVQQVWPIDDEPTIEAITDAFAGQPFYLIDGHHRANAASQFRDSTADPAADWTLCAMFSTEELANFPHHRTLPESVAGDDFVERLSATRPVRPLAGDHPLDQVEPDELIMYHRGTWYGVAMPPTVMSDADPPIHETLAVLDPQRLDTLSASFDPDQATAITTATRYRPGVLPPTALAAEIDMLGGCLFLMRPVTMEQLLAVADAGMTMPPKSTYFEPKVRSGLFLRPCRTPSPSPSEPT